MKIDGGKSLENLKSLDEFSVMRGLLAGVFFLSTEIKFITWGRLDRCDCIGIGAGGISDALPTVGLESGGVLCHESGGSIDPVFMENH